MSDDVVEGGAEERGAQKQMGTEAVRKASARNDAQGAREREQGERMDAPGVLRLPVAARLRW